MSKSSVIQAYKNLTKEEKDSIKEDEKKAKAAAMAAVKDRVLLPFRKQTVLMLTCSICSSPNRYSRPRAAELPATHSLVKNPFYCKNLLKRYHSQVTFIGSFSPFTVILQRV